MNLLYVAAHCPWPPRSGALIRSARLIEQLRRGHAVRVAVLDGPPPVGTPVPDGVAYFPVQDATREAVAPAGRWALRRHVARGLLDWRPSLVRTHDNATVRAAFRDIARFGEGCGASWVEWPYFAWQAMGAGLPRVVADFVDVPSQIQRGCLPRTPWSVHRVNAVADVCKLEWFERRVARRAAGVVVSKAEDGVRLGAAGASVIPNGTDPRPDLSGVETAEARLLFVGAMNYGPNAAAAVWAATELRSAIEAAAGRPVTLELVGGDPAPAVEALGSCDRVEVRGFVADLTPCYARAAVAVAPLLAGGGTKLKVLEALAYGRPLVATAEAVAGHHLRAGTDYLEANTTADFAAACSRLLGDADLRRRLGESGRARVIERHTWDAIGERARRLVDSL